VEREAIDRLRFFTDDDRHPVQTVAHLMKLSFDELHRQAICTLGGIYTIANLVEVIWTSNKPGGFVLYFFYPRISVA
jgi:hypothetical protein